MGKYASWHFTRKRVAHIDSRFSTLERYRAKLIVLATDPAYTGIVNHDERLI